MLILFSISNGKRSDGDRCDLMQCAAFQDKFVWMDINNNELLMWRMLPHR